MESNKSVDNRVLELEKKLLEAKNVIFDLIYSDNGMTNMRKTEIYIKCLKRIGIK